MYGGDECALVTINDGAITDGVMRVSSGEGLQPAHPRRPVFHHPRAVGIVLYAQPSPRRARGELQPGKRRRQGKSNLASGRRVVVLADIYRNGWMSLRLTSGQRLDKMPRCI